MLAIALAALLALPSGVLAQQTAVPASISDMDSIGLFQGNPVVPVGPPGSWDEHIRQIGNVLYEPWDTGKQYKLFYSGYSGSYTGVTYIGYATSTDGIRWTKVGKIIPSMALEGPYVVNDGGTYCLYATRKVNGYPSGFVRYRTSNPAGSWTYDGIVFDRQGTSWEAKLVSAPVVWKEGATWYMLYEGDGYSASSEGVGLATSSDGRSWQRSPSNPVIRKGQFTWFTGNIAPDDIIKIDSTYYLFYHGIFGPSGDSDTGIATSTDLIHWTDSPRSPIVPLDGGYASTTMVMRDSQYVLYYQPRPVGDDMGIYRGYPAKRQQALTVAASPAGGTYYSPQTVTLTSSTPAAIYYTLDGTPPSASSTLYTGPILISASATLKFVATDGFGNMSPVGSEAYVIVLIPPTVTASPPGGVYNSPQTVTLTASKPSEIYYTTDGTEPTTATPTHGPSPLAVSVPTSLVLRYMAVDSAGLHSDVGSQTYTIDTVAPTVTASPPGGTYATAQLVTLAATDNLDPAPKVYYTTDGSAPTPGGQLYTGPITVASTTTIRYLAIDAAGNQSPIGSQTYTIDTVAPTVVASPPGGVYATAQLVTLTATDNLDPAPKVYYTTDGSAPTPASQLYTGPIQVASTTTVRYIAVDAAGNQSPIGSQTYTIDTVAPTVTASPPGGIYATAQLVTLAATDNLDPAPKVYYTTDGSAPTPGGQLYTGPITVASTTTIRYLAIDAAGNQSPIGSQAYTIDTVAPTVTASPPGGIYNSPQTVTLTASKPSEIYYTTDGTEPTTATPSHGPSPLAVSVPTSLALKYMAVDSAGLHSDVGSQTYTIDTVPPTVTASPPGGTYATAQLVTLTATDNLDPAPKVYYTTDGSAPTPASQLYTGPIQVASTTTVRYIAVDAAGNQSPIGSQTYTIDSVPPAVTASPPGGIYNSPQTVTLTATDNLDPAPKVYYTTDGSAPTTASQLYAGPITVASTTTVRYLAIDAAGNQSPIGSQTYTIDTVAPAVTASPPGGTYATAQLVTLTATDNLDPAPKVYYTTDGSAPTPASQLYTGPIQLASTTTIRYLAIDAAGNQSPIVSQAYTIDSVPPTVVASPPGGIYNSPQTVTLTASKPSEIYYTTDGTEPTTATPTHGPSPLAVSVPTSLILKYMAVDSAGLHSDVGSQTYTIDTVAPTVTASPPGGVYATAQLVTLAATDNLDPAPKVYYTTDGSAPTTASQLYTGPITVASTTTVRYLAIDAAGNQSPIGSQTYTIDTVAPTVTASPPGGVYNSAQTVTLTATDDVDPAPKVHYVVNDTAPEPGWQPYTGPITVTTTCTISFMAIDGAGNESPVGSATYTIDTTPPTVVASPPGGTYPVQQSVTLTSDEPATIYYTTDGSAPSPTTPTNGPSPVVVRTQSGTTILKFMAVDTAGNQSEIWTQTYVVDDTPPSVTATPPGGTYDAPQTVTLTAVDSIDPAPRVYYTTDGSDPTPSSTLYASPIQITDDCVLRFVAIDAMGNQSPVRSESYTIKVKTQAPTLTVTPPGGVYGSQQTVTLTSDEPATIYYTTDGTVPTPQTPTNGPSPLTVTIASSAVLNAIAVDKHGTQSTVVTETYTIDMEPPTVVPTPAGGWYRAPQSVSLAATDNVDKSPRIYYTTDGSTPTSDSPVYAAPIVIAAPTTLRYMAVDAVGNRSAVGAQTYTIDTTAPSVVASPPGGLYDGPQSVALTATDDLDPAPRVYYTLDGSTPTSASTPYSGPVVVQSTATLRYVAIDAAGNQSTAGSQIYTVIPPADLPEMDSIVAYGDNPAVPVGPPGSWDEHIRQIGNVLYEPWDTGKEYKLFYSGYSGSYTGVTYIGYATSSDGVRWTKVGKIIPNAPLEGPYVVNDGGTYYLYAISVPGGRESGVARYHTSNPSGGWIYDGIVFTSQGVGWEGKLVSAPVVWKEGSTWYMLYEGDGYAYPYEGIGLATSSDGKVWMRSLCNPVIRKGQFGWFTGNIAPDDIVKVGSTYYLFYHGIFGPSGDSDTGVATSTDLVSWADCPLSPFAPLQGGYSVTTMVARGPRYTFYYQPRPVGDNMGVYRGYPAKRQQGPVVSANPPGGTYGSAQQVVLASSTPALIYYTTDGTAPTTSSPSGASPVRINVESNTTIRFMAVDPLGNQSAVRTETYTINYPPKVITVVFRYDDFGQRSTPSFEVPLMDTFQRHGVPVSVAVIPYVCAGDSHDLSPQPTLPLTPEKAAILMPGVASGMVEVALHGYSHQTTRVPDYTEFQGLPYADQLQRLTDGKALLEGLFGVPITTFVPPWNNYDSNTLYALNALGFAVLSAGPPPGTTVGLGPIKSIPENCGTPDLKALILAARAGSNPQPLLVVMMHPDEFIEEWPEGGWNSLPLFDSLLSWIAAQPDVQTKTLSQVAATM